MSYRLNCQEPRISLLSEQSQQLLGNVALATRQTTWVRHDWVPAHSSNVMRYLDSHYPGRLIGRKGSIVWPPWTSNLPPANFYFWGHLKSIVYSPTITRGTRCGPPVTRLERQYISLPSSRSKCKPYKNPAEAGRKLILASAWLTLRPWRCKRYILPKHRLTLDGLHDVISQEAKLFK
jgi:hypothetical protein